MSTKTKTSDRGIVIPGKNELPDIHKKLKAMVMKADYDRDLLEKIKQKKTQSGAHIVADQIQALIWGVQDDMLYDYIVKDEVWSKFSPAPQPVYSAIRFRGHHNEELVKINIKSRFLGMLYNHIAPALLRAGIKLFLIFNFDTLLVLPGDKEKTERVLDRIYRKQKSGVRSK